MAEKVAELAAGETVQTATGAPTVSMGSVGAKTQVGGQPTTTSATAAASGGIAPGNLVEPDIDDQIYQFNSDDTPLMQLMLKAKRVDVKSPIVDHYMLDEPRSEIQTNSEFKGGGMQGILPVEDDDKTLLNSYGTLLVHGVDGYTPDGQTKTPGQPLMLFVTGTDQTTECPIVRAVNGPKTNKTDEYSKLPEIPAGTKMTIMSNALYETQKNVDPDLIIPQPMEQYLQKRGMNQIVSDYFDAQKKRIPFSKALIAEQAIKNFKVKGNRTLWAGRKGKFKVKTEKAGFQDVYFTEGVRWQFKRILQHTGKWTIEKIIALAKMFYTGEDVPKTGLLLAGKNLLEEFQCIDFSKHPEVKVEVKTNKLGWTVTSFHTVFGDIDIKREPTLDKLGWSNSGALIGEDRLVHYRMIKGGEHSFNDKIEGEEATRSGILAWDALCLKGACHIWIDGENEESGNGTTSFTMWDKETAPTDDDLVSGRVYYLLADCPGISKIAQNGQMWQYTAGADGATGTWAEYRGEVYASEK